MESKKRLRPTIDDEYTDNQAVKKKRKEGTIKGEINLTYQRFLSFFLGKSINGLIKNVTAANVRYIANELLSRNLIKGRGLFCQAILESSMASPDSTPVFAALVALINLKLPSIGSLLLQRIAIKLKSIHKHKDKLQLLPIVKLLANLVNQRVTSYCLPIQFLELLLQFPNDDDSIEIAVVFLLECGYALQYHSNMESIFECFHKILKAGEIQKRTKCLIQGLFAIKKDEFSGYPDYPPELYMVDNFYDQIRHEVSFLCDNDPELHLDVFKRDLHFLNNENHDGLLIIEGMSGNEIAAYRGDEIRRQGLQQ